MQIYGTKKTFLHKKRFNYHRVGLEHENSRRFVVLGLQYS